MCLHILRAANDKTDMEENKVNKIGIIGAMKIEVEALQEKMEHVTLTKKASMEFHQDRKSVV